MNTNIYLSASCAISKDGDLKLNSKDRHIHMKLERATIDGLLIAARIIFGRDFSSFVKIIYAGEIQTFDRSEDARMRCVKADTSKIRHFSRISYKKKVYKPCSNDIDFFNGMYLFFFWMDIPEYLDVIYQKSPENNDVVTIFLS